MKCPKCDYLGFETGDRCRHCGYDFSLAAAPPAPADDVVLRAPDVAAATGVQDLWLRDAGRDAAEVTDAERAASAGAYPLFRAALPDDDEPLIRVPRAPRAPLAVRRTPDMPRLRPALRGERAVEPAPVLDFAAEEPEPERAREPVWAQPVAAVAVADDVIRAGGTRAGVVRTGVAASDDVSGRAASAGRVPGGAAAGLGRRALAAVTDHAILLGVDAVVVYCTLRMASLTMADWAQLPPIPLVGFLGMMKLAYFSAFTAMGGQTIGKMAMGIRVVGAERQRVDAARAIRRTVTGVVSLLPFGLGLVPALLGAERRAFHDRVAGTRVVDLPPA